MSAQWLHSRWVPLDKKGDTQCPRCCHNSRSVIQSCCVHCAMPIDSLKAMMAMRLTALETISPPDLTIPEHLQPPIQDDFIGTRFHFYKCRDCSQGRRNSILPRAPTKPGTAPHTKCIRSQQIFAVRKETPFNTQRHPNHAQTGAAIKLCMFVTWSLTFRSKTRSNYSRCQRKHPYGFPFSFTRFL